MYIYWISIIEINKCILILLNNISKYKLNINKYKLNIKLIYIYWILIIWKLILMYMYTNNIKIRKKLLVYTY